MSLVFGEALPSQHHTSVTLCFLTKLSKRKFILVKEADHAQLLIYKQKSVLMLFHFLGRPRINNISSELSSTALLKQQPTITNLLFLFLLFSGYKSLRPTQEYSFPRH